ncbi:hypothetical protein P692DRAFT_20214077 [Suillus brevipes Sb2]|nr:hypothetical protein P692DRAFT_20214077 [Suillus brevipes Sb2]
MVFSLWTSSSTSSRCFGSNQFDKARFRNSRIQSRSLCALVMFDPGFHLVLIPHYPAHSPSSRSTCHRNLRSCSIWYSLVYLQITGQINFLHCHWQSGHPLGLPSAGGVEKESAYFEMSSFIMEANPSFCPSHSFTLPSC